MSNVSFQSPASNVQRYNVQCPNVQHTTSNVPTSNVQRPTATRQTPPTSNPQSPTCPTCPTRPPCNSIVQGPTCNVCECPTSHVPRPTCNVQRPMSNVQLPTSMFSLHENRRYLSSYHSATHTQTISRRKRTNANVWDPRYGETRTRLTLAASVSLCQFQQVSICAKNITARTFSTVEHVSASHRFISQPVCGDHTVVIRSRFGEKTSHSSLSRSTSNQCNGIYPDHIHTTDNQTLSASTGSAWRLAVLPVFRVPQVMNPTSSATTAMRE